MKVEDEAKDKEEVEDVVAEEEEMRKFFLKREEIKIFLKREEIKIFQEAVEEEEWLIKDIVNAIHVERMVIILGSVRH